MSIRPQYSWDPERVEEGQPHNDSGPVSSGSAEFSRVDG